MSAIGVWRDRCTSRRCAIALVTLFFGDAVQAAPFARQSSRDRPMRVAVTHVQDRSPTAQFAWLEGVAAETLRGDLAAGGLEVIHTGMTSLLAREEQIASGGLPGDARDARDIGARVLTADVIVFAEYLVEGEYVRMIISASERDSQRLLAKVEREGAVDSSFTLFREAAIELLTRMISAPDEAALARVRSLPLPDFETLSWHYEGRLYFSAGRYAEAWYAFSRALQREPGHFLSLLYEIRALREQGMADLAVPELTALLGSAPLAPAQGLPLKDAKHRVLSVSQWRVFQTRQAQALALSEAWATLEDACAVAPDLEPPLYSSALLRVARLYKPFESYVFEQKQQPLSISDAELQKLDSLQRLHSELALHLRLARYWRLRCDRAKAETCLTVVDQRWNSMREVLGESAVSAEAIGAISEELAAERTRLNTLPARVSVSLAPGANPKPPPSPLVIPAELPNTLAWSTVLQPSWPRGFTPIQILDDPSSGKIALGWINWEGEQSFDVPRPDQTMHRARLKARWYAWSRSVDGKSWSAPQLLGEPLNAPPAPPEAQGSARNLNPVVIVRQDGTFALIWNRKSRAYSYLLDHDEGQLVWSTGMHRLTEPWEIVCAQSRDLVHWSTPVRVPVSGPFAAAAMADGSILVANDDLLVTRSFDLFQGSPPKAAAKFVEVPIGGPEFNDLEDRVRDAESDGVPVHVLVDGNGVAHVVSYVRLNTGDSEGQRRMVWATSADFETWTTVYDGGPERPISPMPAHGSVLPSGDWFLARPVETRVEGPNGRSLLRTNYELISGGSGRAPETFVQLPSGVRNLALVTEVSCGVARTRLELDFKGRWSAPIPLAAETLARPDENHEVSLASASTSPAPKGTQSSRTTDSAPQSSTRSVSLLLRPSRSEWDDIANSLALLIAADLNLLQTVCVVVSRDVPANSTLESGDPKPLLTDFRVKWANDMMQMQVVPGEEGVSIRWRVTEVETGSTTEQGTLSSSEALLHETQKLLSSRLGEHYGLKFLDSSAANLFQIRQVWKPYSFRVLSRYALVTDPYEYTSKHFMEWRKEDPDATLWLFLAPYDVPENELREDHHKALNEIVQQRMDRTQTDSPFRSWRGPFLGFDTAQRPTDTLVRFWGDPNEGLKRVPGCPCFHAALLNHALQEGKQDQIREHLSVLKGGADSPTSMGHLALAHEALGEFTEACAGWSGLLEKWGPSDAGFTLEGELDFFTPAQRLARCRIRAGDYESGLADLAKLLDSSEQAENLVNYRIAVLWSTRLEGLRRSGAVEEAHETAKRLLAPGLKQSRLLLPLGAIVSRIEFDRNDAVQGREWLTWVLSRLEDQGERQWYEMYSSAFLAPTVAELRENMTQIQETRPKIGS